MPRRLSNEQLIQRVKAFIKKGNIKQVINHLQKVDHIDDRFVSVVANRLHQIEQDQAMGLLTQEEYESSVNRIIRDILQQLEQYGIHIDEVSSTASSFTFPTISLPKLKLPDFKGFRKYAIRGGLVLLLIALAFSLWSVLPAFNGSGPKAPQKTTATANKPNKNEDLLLSNLSKNKTKSETINDALDTENDDFEEGEEPLILEEDIPEGDENEEVRTENTAEQDTDTEQPVNDSLAEEENDQPENFNEDTTNTNIPTGGEATEAPIVKEKSVAMYDTFMVSKTLIPKVVDGFPNARDPESSEFATIDQNPQLWVLFDSYETETGVIKLQLNTKFDGSPLNEVVFEKQRKLEFKQNDKDYILQFRKIGEIYPIVQITILRKSP